MREAIEAAALVPHADEVPCGVQNIQIAERIVSSQKVLDVGNEDGVRLRPAQRNVVYFLRLQIRCIQAGFDRQMREPRIVLHAAQAFLGDREQQLAVADDARRGVVHLRIVNSKANHDLNPALRKLSSVVSTLSRGMESTSLAW